MGQGELWNGSPSVNMSRFYAFAWRKVKNRIPALIFRQSPQILWAILGKQGRQNENGQAKNKAGCAACVGPRGGMAGAAVERGASAYLGHRCAAVYSVRGARARHGVRRVCAVRTGDGGGADGARRRTERGWRRGLRADAAGRRTEKRRVHCGGAAGSVRDERVCGSAYRAHSVVCADCSGVCGCGMHLRVSAVGRGADFIRAGAVCSCAAADAGSMSGLWRGALSAAG